MGGSNFERATLTMDDNARKDAGTCEEPDRYSSSTGEGPTFDMLIVGLKDHFPARISEWFNGAILTCWGAYLLLHPNLFDTQGSGRLWSRMEGLVWVDYNPESVWGLVAFSVGIMRLGALFINGAWSRTPLLRLISAAVSAFVWTQVTIGLLAVPNTGLVVYPWLVFIDLVAAYRAGRDVAMAEMMRKKNKPGNARGRRSRAFA